MLEQLTSQTPVFSKARCIVRSFGIRRNEENAVCHTLHGAKQKKSWRCRKVQELWKVTPQIWFGFGDQEHIDRAMRL
ncbi:60S ribosomal protein L11 [Lemmus lemmus]